MQHTVCNRYKVADVTFAINIVGDIKCWKHLAWHYEPFATDDSDEQITLTVKRGRVDVAALNHIYTESNDDQNMPTLSIYNDGCGSWVFGMQQPYTIEQNGWLFINTDFTDATFVIDEDNTNISPIKHIYSFTSAAMLFYLLGALKHNVVIGHASCILYHDKVYIFIAKSGTGKSTHTQLWLKNIEGASLLNDDHPALKVNSDGVTAYGTPWSGKLDVYKNISAPLAAIGRINRASTNSIDRLNPIEAYASLSTSLSGLNWNDQLSEKRHHLLEQIISMVPCYRVNCRPDDQAAIISHQILTHPL